MKSAGGLFTAGNNKKNLMSKSCQEAGEERVFEASFYL
jgi:hypothetical protein